MRAIEKYDDKFSKQQEKTDGAVFDYQREMDKNGGLIHCAPPTPRKYNFHVGLVKLLSGVRLSTKGDNISGLLSAFVLPREYKLYMLNQMEMENYLRYH